jgi:hypothetical protein
MKIDLKKEFTPETVVYILIAAGMLGFLLLILYSNNFYV